jgi:3-phosphoshikimate 1-carboxyvinyltransferase
MRFFDGEKVDDPIIDTYEDHRMAMSLAPLAIVCPQLRMMDPEVVKKSFPEFWNELKKLGASIQL